MPLTMVVSPDAAARSLAKSLPRSRDRVVLVTWLNHFSIQKVDWDAASAFDIIGIDGTLLQLFLRANGIRVGRTSADLLLPILLTEIGTPRVALIGAAPGVAEKAARRLSNVVYTTDGYSGLESLLRTPDELISLRPDVVVVGVGPGRQEQVALAISRLLPSGYVFTAGGWIDQLSESERYFPPMVHRLRLGWALRIAREPQRLWRRYTSDAFRFVRTGSSHVSRLGSFGAPNVDHTGLQRHPRTDSSQATE